jgi:hypothetical protein
MTISASVIWSSCLMTRPLWVFADLAAIEFLAQSIAYYPRRPCPVFAVPD